MKKYNGSVILSLALVFIFSGMLTALCFTAPMLTDWYISAANRPLGIRTPILTVFYCAVPFAYVTLYNLARLLVDMLCGSVFTAKNVKRLMSIAVCLLAAAIIFFAAGFFYSPFFLLSVMALFVSLIVLVVKSCFHTASIIKDENDMTI